MRRNELVVQVFFELVKAGLWEKQVRLLPFGEIDFTEVYRLADEQSVVGLVAAGLDHVQDMKVTKPLALPFLKSVISLENRNTEMNRFIVRLFSILHEQKVFPLLIKGQGIARCYSRPQWRASGDIDLLVAQKDYAKAKAFLAQKADPSSVKEIEETLEFGFSIDPWVVELHGTLMCRIYKKMDKCLSKVQERCCELGETRIWKDDARDVPLPSVDLDIIVIFTHFLKHFFRNGIGLRQICDWCRLLWTYRDVIDRDLLESHLKEMDIQKEWKAFAAYAVGYLGMPEEAMPFYDSSIRWRHKARRINTDILQNGNFGHNSDDSYQEKCPYIISKFISLWRYFCDAVRHTLIFPKGSLHTFFMLFSKGIHSVIHGV